MDTGATYARNKIAGLDYLRALAIIVVFLYHYKMFGHPLWMEDVCSFGWAGVDLFFVLSGYLIASQVFRGIQQGNFSFKEFVLKRSFRILPAYWSVVALYFLVPAMAERDTIAPLWKFLTFTQNTGLDLRHHRAFSHAWSLCVEEHFYLLFPLGVMMFTRLKIGRSAILIIALLFLSGMLIRYEGWNYLVSSLTGKTNFGMNWYKWIYYPTWNRLDGLLMGISIAGIFTFFPKCKSFVSSYSSIVLIAGLAVITAAWFLCEDPLSFQATVFGFTLLAVGFGLMVASASTQGSLLSRYPSIIATAVARLSYPVYLTHKKMVHITQGQAATLNIKEDSNLMLLLCIISSIAGAVVLHFTVERPFLYLREKLIANMRKD